MDAWWNSDNSRESKQINCVWGKVMGGDGERGVVLKFWHKFGVLNLTKI